MFRILLSSVILMGCSAFLNVNSVYAKDAHIENTDVQGVNTQNKSTQVDSGVLSESELNRPLINLDVVVDTDGITEAILTTNKSMLQVVEVLENIADNQELTPEQAEVMLSTTQNINQLAIASAQVVDALPEVVASTKQSLVQNSQVFLHDLKIDILIMLVIVVIALVVVIVCLYWFVIKPMQSTVINATTNVASMANSIQITAQSLQETNKTNAQLVELLQSPAKK
ncbi:hypothetical protein R3X26_02560 [Vibrio sp. TH_r3]|uniref:hypothetical protein n=1 Tax=Vibrio sp. TH_r3 TaxID=3082084 RepID=UPI0029541669|nr:hypothetical protein [Vibrio sp. TH_r3]MDV7103282.1 hypothetical protein [Vibrio sp. TH_r3]